jgi:hypothetical protein
MILSCYLPFKDKINQGSFGIAVKMSGFGRFVLTARGVIIKSVPLEEGRPIRLTGGRLSIGWGINFA